MSFAFLAWLVLQTGLWLALIGLATVGLCVLAVMLCAVVNLVSELQWGKDE